MKLLICSNAHEFAESITTFSKDKRTIAKIIAIIKKIADKMRGKSNETTEEVVEDEVESKETLLTKIKENSFILQNY